MKAHSNTASTEPATFTADAVTVILHVFIHSSNVYNLFGRLLRCLLILPANTNALVYQKHNNQTK